MNVRTRTSTYRSDYPSSLRTTCGFNDTKPIHVRSNLGLRRRQIRAASVPPSHHRTAPLLAWNEPDEAQHEKPEVGLRQAILNQGSTFVSETPFAHTAIKGLLYQRLLSSQHHVKNSCFTELFESSTNTHVILQTKLQN